jgi:hypothetical protein
MIKEKEISIKITKQNIDYYSKILDNINLKDIMKINPINLTKGTHKIITAICDNCGNEKNMEFKTYYKNTKSLKEEYYCNQCKNIRFKETCFKKYGEEHYMKLNEYKEKIYKTNIEKYGFKMASMSNEFEIKKQNTCLIKYNVKHVQQNKKINNKTIKTMIERYGVKYPIQNNKIKNKIKKTNIKKYNVINPLLINRYDYNDNYKNKRIVEKTNKTKFENLKNKYKYVKFISYDYENFFIKCEKCNNIFKINKGLFFNRIKLNSILCTKCFPVNSKMISSKELQLINFIEKNYKGKIIKNCRNIIKPYELDVYIPEFKLAIEFNGLWWHNELYKPINYHMNKTELCEKKNIQLIHIWEDDWDINKDYIKSLILNKLKVLNKNININECNIKVINNVNENFILKDISDSFKLGLFFKNELIALMSFKEKENKNYQLYYFEKPYLKLNNSINLMINYFIKNNNVKNIITKIDRSYYNGKEFENNNFILYKKTKPNIRNIINNYKIFDSGNLIYKKKIL